MRAIAVSPMGQTLAVCTSDGKVTIWNAANGDRLCTLSSSERLSSVSFSRDGTMLATGSSDSRATIWDVRGWRKLRFVGPGTQRDPDNMCFVAFSRGSDLILASLCEGPSIWDARSGKRLSAVATGASERNAPRLDGIR